MNTAIGHLESIMERQQQNTNKAQIKNTSHCRLFCCSMMISVDGWEGMGLLALIIVVSDCWTLLRRNFGIQKSCTTKSRTAEITQRPKCISRTEQWTAEEEGKMFRRMGVQRRYKDGVHDVCVIVERRSPSDAFVDDEKTWTPISNSSHGNKSVCKAKKKLRNF